MILVAACFPHHACQHRLTESARVLERQVCHSAGLQSMVLKCMKIQKLIYSHVLSINNTELILTSKLEMNQSYSDKF